MQKTKSERNNRKRQRSYVFANINTSGWSFHENQKCITLVSMHQQNEIMTWTFYVVFFYLNIWEFVILKCDAITIEIYVDADAKKITVRVNLNDIARLINKRDYIDVTFVRSYCWGTLLAPNLMGALFYCWNLLLMRCALWRIACIFLMYIVGRSVVLLALHKNPLNVINYGKSKWMCIFHAHNHPIHPLAYVIFVWVYRKTIHRLDDVNSRSKLLIAFIISVENHI